jgi:uncharacterized protein YraI
MKTRMTMMLIGLSAILLLVLALAAAAQTDGAFKTQYNLNLRAQPQLDAEIIAVVPHNTTLSAQAISEDGEWVMVKYGEHSGWLYREYLLEVDNGVVEITPTEPVPTTPQVTITATTDNRVWGEVQPAEYCNREWKIALYAKTDIWYVQPYRDSRRNVRINADCTWTSFTHSWYVLAAHLVPANYTHPHTSREGHCPPLGDPTIVQAASCYTR